MSSQIRLNKFISDSGFASRRQADHLIASGQVTVNNQTITQLGTKIIPNQDSVSVAGQKIKPSVTKVYYLLNKPRGVVSTTVDPSGKQTVIDLVPSSTRLYPVGRLDVDSEGLMLLTNDGDLAYRLTHPKFHHPKTYHVLVNGSPSTKTIKLLQRGIRLKSGLNRPDSVSIHSHQDGNTWLSITIHQGQKHQVRRLIKSVNHQVLRLLRVQLGPFHLSDLKGQTHISINPPSHL